MCVELLEIMEMRGIEPLTFALRTRRSAKLSYIPCGSKKAKVKSKKVCYSAFDLFPILDFQSNDIFYFYLFTFYLFNAPR
jgi:hypothetical protein